MDLSNLPPLLQNLADRLDELKQVLDAEHEAIGRGEPETLTELAQTKLRLSEDLDNLERQRQAQFQALGLQADQLPEADSDSPLGKLWQHIRERSRECQRLNQINGITIEKQRRRTETTLALLYGRQGDAELYSASGTQQATTISQTLTKA